MRARVCRTCRTGHRHGDQRAAASRVFTGFLLLPGGRCNRGSRTTASRAAGRAPSATGLRPCAGAALASACAASAGRGPSRAAGAPSNKQRRQHGDHGSSLRSPGRHRRR